MNLKWRIINELQLGHIFRKIRPNCYSDPGKWVVEFIDADEKLVTCRLIDNDGTKLKRPNFLRRPK